MACHSSSLPSSLILGEVLGVEEAWVSDDESAVHDLGSSLLRQLIHEYFVGCCLLQLHLYLLQLPSQIVALLNLIISGDVFLFSKNLFVCQIFLAFGLFGRFLH